ncbi:VWA domain-containing protein [Marinobacter daepoensis]|uniref:VWA domain-containing protein n=1 Tax=Marinobacter daepoensis TaxID=262077 RepID=UPI001C967BBE|nr:VWA domain-containing protein [Marinobacter daepoensis]MBY6032492.1 VWA domain-containing protein [Marinobacter daepoensis]
MKRFRHVRMAAVLLLLSLPVFAQESSLSLPADADIRIVVDISGSMKETDPLNLRRPAVRLLARMVPEGARAGLWTFGQYVNMLVPYDVVDQAWRETAIERSSQINSVALHTNLGLAMEKASNAWVSGGRLENTHLIVLSDGKVDVPGEADASAAEERRILSAWIPELKAQGATIHTVGLSEQADIGFLRTLARETGGSFQLAQSAEALSLAFANALNTAVPQEQVPIEGDGFNVDAGVKEFTALIFSGPEAATEASLKLAGPDGAPYTYESAPDHVNWASEPGYNLITVTEPAAGRWRLLGDLGQGSRVTVVSDLRMAVSPIPTTFTENEPLRVEVAFFEEMERLTGADFLSVIDVSLSITASDGRKGTKELSAQSPPEDGIYRDTVARLPVSGQYQIDVLADAGTFSRKFSVMTSFVIPGEEAPLEVVREPLVPDLSEQAEALPGFEGAESPAPAVLETPAEVAEPPTPEQKVQPAAPEQDASEVGASDSDTKKAPETLWGLPLWAWGSGVALLVVISGFVLFAVRQKRHRAEAQEAAAAGRETLDDLDVDEEPPVIEPENDAVEFVPEAEAEEATIPEVTETVPVEPEEPEIPTVEETVLAEAVEDPDPSEADDPASAGLDVEEDDEFGLEDFDLSEFDDLSEYREDSPANDWPEPTDKKENSKK